jgi:hypothetical protein
MEEHEQTSILVEDDTKERVLQSALRDIKNYSKPYLIKLFAQRGQVEWYRIQECDNSRG